MASARIQQLLEQLASFQADLADAASPAARLNAIADIRWAKHTLWLAGYDPEATA